jgi:hypothetical protein
MELKAEEAELVVNIFTRRKPDTPWYLVTQIDSLSKQERAEIIKRINEFPVAEKGIHELFDIAESIKGKENKK